MNKWLRLLLLAVALSPIFTSIAVLAIASPTSTPTIDTGNIYINRNLIEDNDRLVEFEFNIPYTSIPSVSATQAFLFSLIHPSTGAVLATVLPYTYIENGYNEGVSGFYLSGSANLTWGVQYIIRISENPAQFTEAHNYDYVIPTSAYTSATTQESNQSQVSTHIIAAANRMHTYHPTYQFTDSSTGVGTVLSSPYGEEYFRGAIPGIQAMAPSLYNVQVITMNTADRVWTTAQFTAYANRFNSGNYTWVGASVNATANQFGIPPDTTMALIIILPLCVGASIIGMIKFRKIEPGLVVSFLFLIFGALLGWMPLGLFALAFQISGIYLAWVIFKPN